MRKIPLFASLASTLLIIPLQAYAGYTLYEKGDTKLQLSGDLRLRVEQDWDSRREDGTERDDRARIRTRARVRLDGQLNESWKAVVRLRSGDNDSQQSPHITLYDFEDNPKGPSDFNLDLWYGQYASSGWEVWAGRNLENFWHQDEVGLDDDVTIMGTGLTYTHALGAGKLSWKGGYGALPAGMQNFSGEVATAQLVYENELDDLGLTLAGGYIGINADPDDSDGNILLTENNTRDYQTAVAQLQFRTTAFDRPLKFGADYGHNFKNYDNEQPGSFSEFHKDDVDYYVVFLNYGSTKQAGDWLLGYYYSYIEALAVNSSYSDDATVRWGNQNQTRATNLKGSEFRTIYKVRKNLNIVARVWLIDAIRNLNQGDVAKEDGNRARIDFDYQF